MQAFHTILFLMLHCTLKIAYGKYKNIKWLNRKILTMPIETSEEVIFKKVTTKRIVKVSKHL